MSSRKFWKLKESAMQNPTWVLVVVYEYPSPTRPILVNVYAYPERKDAVTEQNRVKKEAALAHGGAGKLIACRVRPLHEMEESAFRY